MTWYEAVLSTLGIIGFWAALVLVPELISGVFQKRMDLTLWKSLPYCPAPAEDAPGGEE